MHQTLQTYNYPFAPYPSGWYVLANSEDIPAGFIKNFHYFGKDIVIYRGQNQQVHVIDAHCPHLGAHMGHGGKVIGNNIRCPFHHWQFDESGQCVDIPYSSPQHNACTKHWTSIERNGQILTFYSEDGTQPFCEVPEIDELHQTKASGWSKSYFNRYQYHAHIQEVIENIVDLGHFKPIHNVSYTPKVEKLEFNGPCADIIYTTQNTVLGKQFNAALHFQYYGPAYTALQISTMTDISMIASLTPIDEFTLCHRFHFRLKKIVPLLNSVLLRVMAKQIEKDFIGDLPIWEHKIYREHPILCKGEGNIMKMRQWSKQFYPMYTKSKI